jgi:hypothetical protein
VRALISKIYSFGLQRELIDHNPVVRVAIAGANRAAVDPLDDDDARQPNATQPQPQPFDDAATLAELEELFGESR